MDWLRALFTDTNAVAHIILVYALVVALGTLLGRIKVAGISLGVTFVLFVGLAAGHFGLTVPEPVLFFIRDFGLTLFIFFVGLQVGPSFFSSFKSGGLVLNLLTVMIVLLGIVVTVALWFLLKDWVSLPQMLGVHYGAVTNTPGLGATQEALDLLHYEGENIAVAYACAYPLGVVGAIFSAVLLRKIFSIDLAEEDKHWETEEKEHNREPIFFHVEVTNPAVAGKTLGAIREFTGRSFICSRILSKGELSSPTAETVVQEGDVLRIVAAPEDRLPVTAFFGGEKQGVDLATEKSPLATRTILITREKFNGMTLKALALNQMDGVNITRVFRAGMTLFPYSNLHLQVGDQVYCVGPEPALQRLETLLGNKMKKLYHPNIFTIFVGLACLGEHSDCGARYARALEARSCGRAAHRRDSSRTLRELRPARHLHDAVGEPHDARNRDFALSGERRPRRGRELRRRHHAGERASLRAPRAFRHAHSAHRRGDRRKKGLQNQLPQHRGPHGGRNDRSSCARLRGDLVGEKFLVGCVFDRLSSGDVPSHPHGAAPSGASLGLCFLKKTPHRQEKKASGRRVRRLFRRNSGKPRTGAGGRLGLEWSTEHK